MSYQTLMGLFTATQVLFAFAFGSCVGSLINVLVYRMPRGLSVVSPPSRCPKCDHLLTWRENIPVFGWLLLRGRCRFCKAPISPEYPIVEGVVGLVFAAFYVLWYVVGNRDAAWMGFDWSVIKPEWAMNGFARTWPVFVAMLVLVSSLIAMTIVDAKTFTIPLGMAWTPTVAAAVAHPAWAAWLQSRGKPWRFTAEGQWWALATPGPDNWPVLCAALGAILGLLIANILVSLGVVRRSFADYDEWEAGALEAAATKPGGGQAEDTGEGPGSDSESASIAPSARRTVGVVAICLALCGVSGGFLAPRLGLSGPLGVLAGVLAAVPIAGAIRRALSGRPLGRPDEDSNDGSPAEMWVQYPHARREVIKELLFLTPCLALALLGWYVGQRVGQPWRWDAQTMTLEASRPIPLWLSVLGGVCLGYLAGGGIVWAIRIFGTLGFGKEAMGLGDVHLLAAVGACLGWLDSVLAFFVAPFIALYVVLVLAAWTGGGRRAMPYGPYLAIATLVVVLGKAGVEAGLGDLFGAAGPLDFP